MDHQRRPARTAVALLRPVRRSSNLLVALALLSFGCARSKPGAGAPEGVEADAPARAESGFCTDDPCCDVDSCTELGSTEPSSSSSSFTLDDGTLVFTVDNVDVATGKYVLFPDAPSSSTDWTIKIEPENNALIQPTFGTGSTPWGWCRVDQNGVVDERSHNTQNQATSLPVTVPPEGAAEANSYAFRVWGCSGSTFVTHDPKVVVRSLQSNGYPPVPSTSPIDSCSDEPTSDAARTCACLSSCTAIEGDGGNKGCGWCTSTQIAMEGNEDGPRSGSCDNWVWDHNWCDCSTITECDGIKGDGGDDGCGWCTGLEQAMVGSSDGPAVGSCPGDWIWDADDC